jgi:hypothetical protein
MKRRLFNLATTHLLLLGLIAVAHHAGCQRQTGSSLRAGKATTMHVQRPEKFALMVDKFGEHSIAFSWTQVPGAHQYRIEISEDGKDFFGSSLIDPGLTDYEFGGFDPGESFIFRVVAVAANGTDIAQSSNLPVKLPGRD